MTLKCSKKHVFKLFFFGKNDFFERSKKVVLDIVAKSVVVKFHGDIFNGVTSSNVNGHTDRQTES